MEMKVPSAFQSTTSRASYATGTQQGERSSALPVSMWELSRMAWLLPLVRGNAQEPWQLLMFALLGPTRSFVRDTVRAFSPQTPPLTDELGSALVARSFLCASYVWATVCRAFSRRNTRNWLPPGGRRKKTHAALKKGYTWPLEWWRQNSR